jgi:hypothetical protein
LQHTVLFILGLKVAWLLPSTSQAVDLQNALQEAVIHREERALSGAQTKRASKDAREVGHSHRGATNMYFEHTRGTLGALSAILRRF